LVRQHVRFVIANRFVPDRSSSARRPVCPPGSPVSWPRRRTTTNKGVESVVLEGIRRGVFREMPPRLVVFGLLGMLNWV